MDGKEFGQHLRTLRENRRLTLRDVEEAAGVSNGYLSLLERGMRGKPSARILKDLAKFYGVPPEQLFEGAGYLTEENSPSTEDDRLDHALAFIRSDPDYRFGTRMPGEMTPAVKRFVIKMYEELTGKRLMPE
jgi:HTH-type transcriptional regulator, competence development regulator